MPRPLMAPPELLHTDLTGRRYVVTGANSGIGRVTASQLVAQGADVTLAVRRPDDARSVAAELDGPGSVDVVALDLGDLASVRRCADTLLAADRRIDGLLNNAGVMNTSEGRTKDGFETQIGINHLGHYLLTELLLDRLRASAPSRVVNVSSCYHDVAQKRTGEVVLDDLHFERRAYDGWKAYAQAKLANVLHARALAKRLDGTGVTAVSLHPGWVRTRLIRHSLPVWAQDTILRPFLRAAGMIEPWEGAQTSLYTLLAPEVEEHPGAYFSQIGRYRDRALDGGGWPMRSPNPQVHDDGLVDALDAHSRQLVGPAA